MVKLYVCLSLIWSWIRNELYLEVTYITRTDLTRQHAIYLKKKVNNEIKKGRSVDKMSSQKEYIIYLLLFI